MSSNFTVIDLVGSLCGVLLFLPLMTAPGYIAGWFSDAFGFRKLSAPWRVLISVPLSVALCPILSYWLGAVFGWTGVAAIYIAATLFFLLLLAGLFGHERLRIWLVNLRQAPRVSFIVAAAWLLIALLSLIDLQVGNRLYFSATVYDHSVRTAITDAITRTGVKPDNPFYDLGSPAPLRYHYFWFIACSLINRFGGHFVNARQAIIASVVWSGWAFAAVIPIFLRQIFSMTGDVVRRISVIALLLTVVTGLDILPTIYYWTRGKVFADMEWWNNQITSWWGSGLWVPHHLAALVIGVTALLLLWSAALEQNKKLLIGQSILGGAALASMVGTSVYVALVFAVFLVLWTATTLFLRERRHTLALLIAGVATLVLIVPYVLSLAHSGGAAASGAQSTTWLVKPTLRRFSPLDNWLDAHPVSIIVAAILRLMFLPLNYFLELGVFICATVVYMFAKWKGAPNRLPLIFTGLLAATSIFLCTFFHSAVIANNDLGTRGFLPAQFIFLLWTAELFANGASKKAAASSIRQRWWRSPVWAALIILGAAGTIYELALLRFEGLLADDGIIPVYFSPDRQLGRRTYALRSAYDQLRQLLPSTAIIQNNPQWKYTDYFYGLYADRQTAAYDPQCGTEFGGSPATCKKFYPLIKSFFSDEADENSDEVARISKRLGVNAVLVKDLDASWREPRSWVWQTTPMIANDYVRIYVFTQNTLNAAKPRHDLPIPVL